jgi:ubiquilin
LFGAPPQGQQNTGTTATQNDGTNASNQQPQNPFAALFNPALFGQQPQGGNQGTTSPPPVNPFLPQNNPLFQNPEALNQMMQAFGGAGGLGGLGAGAGAGAGAGGDGAGNFANLLDMFGGGAAGGRPASPPDNRPPEERYATQLRQLNDMGFYDFDRNVQALRRTGGSVNGAIEYLLGNP